MTSETPWVEGDVTRLTQAIFNLLSNATKYTDPGGKIWLTVEREGEQAGVRVRDNGSGMKADLVPKVFDLFTQGERTLDRSQGGLGLGLALVKRLVEIHGGTVEARSEGSGKGSEFTVRLPALAAEEVKPASPRVTVSLPPAVRVGRALVIDDNFDVAESMTWMLESLPREIKMAHSGQAALEMMGDGWKPLGPKSLLIREAITAHPDKGNTELAGMINDSDARMDDKIKVSVQDVAQQRQAMKKQGAAPAAEPEVKPAPQRAEAPKPGNGRKKPGRKPGRKAATRTAAAPAAPAPAATGDIFPHIEAIREAVRQLGAEQVKKIVGLFE